MFAFSNFGDEQPTVSYEKIKVILRTFFIFKRKKKLFITDLYMNKFDVILDL